MRRRVIAFVLIAIIAFAIVFRPGRRAGPAVSASSLPPPITITLRGTNVPLRVFPGVGGVLIRLQDGSLWQWGGGGPLGRNKVPQQVGTNFNWVEAFMANNHCVGRQSDGTIWEWGYCGDGKIRPTPWRVGTDSDWVGIAAGDVHAIALKRNGMVWGWGDNSNHQLSPLAQLTAPAPMQLSSATDWKLVACGQGSHSVGLRADGTLWAWGSVGGFEGGQPPTVLLQPTKICVDTNWTDLQGGPILHGVADDSVWEVFYSPPAPLENRTNVCRLLATPPNFDRSALAFCGRAELYAIHDDSRLYRSVFNFGERRAKHGEWDRVGPEQNWIYLAGHSTAVGLTSDGTLWTWGLDPGCDPIPDAQSQLKMLKATVMRRFGVGPRSLQTTAMTPYQTDPRPLIKLKRSE